MRASQCGRERGLGLLFIMGFREEKELQLGVAVGITWAFFASRGPPYSFFFFFGVILLRFLF